MLGAVDQPFAFYMFVYFLKPSFNRQLVCKFELKENNFFIVLILFMHINLQKAKDLAK